MQDQNRIIRGLWVNGELNRMQQLCIRSYLANGHEFHLYTYNTEIEVPPGTTIRNAGQVIPEKDIFYDDRGSLCSFADLFRYELLFEYGGWWVDMDLICLKPFDFASEYVFASEHDPAFNQKVCIGAIKVPPHSDIMQYCRQTAYKIISDFTRVPWGSLGCGLFYSFMEIHGSYMAHVQPPHVFCPVPYYHYQLLFSDLLIDFTEKTYALHFWNEMLRLNQIDPDNEFHENSLFQRLTYRYG
ncbi:MAG: hypothetical protein LBQ60_00925 [Bacteroidales bacterium]|jgi:hypothetical protein|nr:hypothetical protein [Bacteroidales bacterium]